MRTLLSPTALLSNTALWRCLALIALVLMLWAGFSSEPIPQYVDHFDKWTHCLAFALITTAFLLAFPTWPLPVVVVLMLLLGFGIELGQGLFVARRSFDWIDFLVDALGIFIGLVATLGLRRWS